MSELLNVLNIERNAIRLVKEQVQGRFLTEILGEVYCSVYNVPVPGRAQHDWLRRITLTLHFLTASGCSDLPIIHL